MELTVKIRECVEVYNSQAATIRFSDPGTTVAIAQIMHAVRPIVDSYDTQRMELLREYGKIDPETDELVIVDGQVSFSTPTIRRTFESKHREMLNATTTVTVPKLDGKRIGGDGLTPAALLALIPFGLKLEDAPTAP